jgi:hypothetical protein
MKKRKKTAINSVSRRFPRLLGVGLLFGIILLTVGVVAGISRQPSGAKGSLNGPLGGSNTRASSLTDQVVQQTGQIKPLTQEEAQRLATELKTLANRSTDGLQPVNHPDGTVSIDLQGRFQNVALAKRNEDGAVSQSCVDNPAAGAVFFGIDPRLVGVKTGARVSPSSTTPTQK